MTQEAISEARLEQLFVRWKEQGDRLAREELTCMFLQFAHNLARRYARGTNLGEDLDQVASLALLKAIDRFDPAHGSSFTAFATPTILGELRRYFRDTRWAAHVPRRAQELVLKIQAATQELSTRCGYTPSVAALAEYLELDVETVLEGLYAANAYDATSLHTPVTGAEEGNQILGDVIGVEDERYELIETDATAARLLRTLPEIDRRILHMRFIGEMTQSEIAQQIGISQMQISRRLRLILATLHEQAADP